MEFRILGPLEVEEGGRPVDVGGPRQRALLAILLTRANEVVSRDRLADDLFGEEPREAAANLVQVYVSRLRTALEPSRARGSQGDVVVTRAPGYLARVDPDRLDLTRFERLAEEGRLALAAGDPQRAADLLAEALALWRGPALAEFAYESFASAEAARLEELRVAALEDRIEADLALGRHAAAVAELQALVLGYPLRERLRALLMLALYRSGRQVEALDVYQETRRVLVDELGIEPGAALQEMERRVLQQDPALDLQPGGALALARPAERAVLVVSGDDSRLDEAVGLAVPLCRAGIPRELLVAQLVERPEELTAAAAALHARRAALADEGVPIRVAAFTSSDRPADAVRLVAEQAVDLLLLTGAGRDGGAGSPEVLAILAEAPCDVAILLGARGAAAPLGGPLVVPFGGGEHDWAALELGAWLASAHRTRLVLVGSVGDPESMKRDASRLLARASLIVQQFADVPAEPLLTPPGPDGVLGAVAPGGALVVGLSARWRGEGLGRDRERIAGEAPVPALFVRRGVRPGGLTPAEGLTRFTWSLAGQADV